MDYRKKHNVKRSTKWFPKGTIAIVLLSFIVLANQGMVFHPEEKTEVKLQTDDSTAQLQVSIYNPENELQPGIICGYLYDSLVIADSSFNGQNNYEITFHATGIEIINSDDQFVVAPNPVNGNARIFTHRAEGEMYLYTAQGRLLDRADLSKDKDLKVKEGEGTLILQYVTKKGIGSRKIISLNNITRFEITTGQGISGLQQSSLKAATEENFRLEYTDPTGSVENLIQSFMVERGQAYVVSEMLQWVQQPGKRAVYLKGDFSSDATLNIPGQAAIVLGADGKLGKEILVDRAVDSLDIYASAPYATAEQFRKAVRDTIFLDTLLQRQFHFDTKGPQEATLEVYGLNNELLATLDAGDDFSVEKRVNNMPLTVRATGEHIQDNYIKQLLAQAGETIIDANDIKWQHVLNAQGEEYAAYEITVEDTVYRGISAADGSFNITHLSNKQSGLEMIFSQNKDNYLERTDTIISARGVNTHNFGELLAQYTVIEKSGGERVTKLLGDLNLEQALFSGDATFSFTDIRDEIATELVVDNPNYLLFKKNLVLQPGTTVENPPLEVSEEEYFHALRLILQSDKEYKRIKPGTAARVTASKLDTILYSSENGIISADLFTNRETDQFKVEFDFVAGHNPQTKIYDIETFVRDTFLFKGLDWNIAMDVLVTDGNGYPIEGAKAKPTADIFGYSNENGIVRFDSIPPRVGPYNEVETGNMIMAIEKEGLQTVFVEDSIKYGNLYSYTAVMDQSTASYEHNVKLRFSSNTHQLPNGVQVPIETDEQNLNITPSNETKEINLKWYSPNARSPVNIGDIVGIPGFENIPGVDTAVYKNLILNFVGNAITYDNISLKTIVQDQDGERVPGGNVFIDGKRSAITNDNGEAYFSLAQRVTATNQKQNFSLEALVVDTDNNDVDFKTPSPVSILIDEANEVAYLTVNVDKGGNGGGEEPPVSELVDVYAYSNNSSPANTKGEFFKNGQVVMQATINGGKYVTNILEIDKDLLPFLVDSARFTVPGSEDYVKKVINNLSFSGAKLLDINVPQKQNGEYEHAVSGNVTSSLADKSIASGNYAYFVLPGQDTTWMFINNAGNFQTSFKSAVEDYKDIPMGVKAPGHKKTEKQVTIDDNVTENFVAEGIRNYQTLRINAKDEEGNPIDAVLMMPNGTNKTGSTNTNGYVEIADILLQTDKNNIFTPYQNTLKGTKGEEINKTVGYTAKPGVLDISFVANLSAEELHDLYVRFELDNNLGKGMIDGGYAELNIPGMGIVNVDILNKVAEYGFEHEDEQVNIIATFKNMPGYENTTPKTFMVDNNEIHNVMAAGKEHYTTLLVPVTDNATGEGIPQALVINSGVNKYTNSDGVAELSIRRITGPNNVEILNMNTTTRVKPGNSGKDFDDITDALVIDEAEENQPIGVDVKVANDVKDYQFRVNNATSITGKNRVANTPNIFEITTSQGTFTGTSDANGNVIIPYKAKEGENVSLELGNSKYDTDYFYVQSLGKTSNDGPLNMKAEGLNGSYGLAILGDKQVVDNPIFLYSSGNALAYNGYLAQRTIVSTDRSTNEFAGEDFMESARGAFNYALSLLTSPYIKFVNFSGDITETENMPSSPNNKAILYRDSDAFYGNGSYTNGSIAFGPGPNQGLLGVEIIERWIPDGPSGSVQPVIANPDIMRAVGINTRHFK